MQRQRQTTEGGHRWRMGIWRKQREKVVAWNNNNNNNNNNNRIRDARKGKIVFLLIVIFFGFPEGKISGANNAEIIYQMSPLLAMLARSNSFAAIKLN